MPRKFYFDNGLGGRIGLNGEDGIYLSGPTGLGSTADNGYAGGDSGFFARTRHRDRQIPISFDVVMTGDEPYADFSRVTGFMHSAPALRLIYAPGAEEYIKDVDVSSIGKTEVDPLGWLYSAVSLAPLTPWYRPRARIIYAQPPSEGAPEKRYTYRYSYRYRGQDSAGGVELQCEGQYPSGLKVSIGGRLVNPAIALYDADSGEAIGRCALDATIDAGSELLYSSQMGAEGISADGEDITAAMDISAQCFFRLPPGRRCRLTISADNTIASAAEITIYDYYKAV